MHRRLGHASLPAVKQLITENLCVGTQVDLSSDPPVCDACLQGKQSHSPVAKVMQGHGQRNP